MPRVVSDIVDVYVFRRLHGRVQFLLLQRKADVSMGNTWQSFHAHIDVGDTTMHTTREAVKAACGLEIDEMYSADYVNQFYDEPRDAMVLAPVFAVTLTAQSPVALGPEFRDAGWFDRDEATIRLPFSGQRWAVRHIDEIMSMGDAERAIYKLDGELTQPAYVDDDTPAPDRSGHDDWDDDDEPLPDDESDSPGQDSDH